MKKKTISQKFRRSLALIVVIALTASVLFIFVLNTGVNHRNNADMIRSTLADIEQDVEDTSDINMLELTRWMKECVVKVLGTVDTGNIIAVNSALRGLAREESLSELSIVSTDNVVIYSSKDEYIGFDMDANEDTQAFDALNHGATEIVQPVRSNAYDGEGNYDEYNKYAGVPLEGIGYLQVAINSREFQRQIDTKIRYIAANRHIGQFGYVIIANMQDQVISNAGGAVGGSLTEMGLNIADVELGKTFSATVDGEEHLCCANFVEGYYMIGVIPMSEVEAYRNRSVVTNILTELIIFVLLFFVVNKTIRSVVISGIQNINGSLHRIIGGELNTRVDEYSTVEFSQLSDDINSTVDSLKDYMARENEKIKKELEFAKNIQMSALPKVNSLAHYASSFGLYATINTAKEVGGDFYDFYMLDESRLAVLIADVSGKGVPAAMFMMTCKTMIKNLVESGIGLGEAFAKANDELCDSNDAGMFVTAWMGVLDLKTGHLDFVNAGHNPPLFYNSEREFEFMKSRSGFVLAGLPDRKYTVQTVELKPGDKFFLYTDGVTEAINPRDEMYGEKRLLDYLNKAKDQPLGEMLVGVKADIDRFAEEAEQFDDITMLAVSYK